jgi:DNA excision repair protein ERCC-3
MIAFNQNKTITSQKIIEKIKSREWGLLVLDEVHVVPAHIFRNVTSIIKAHCRLGLTATLVREDERIKDLIFLIGPKLYEANWLDLTKNRYIASVMCNEVICPMTKEFNILYREQVEKQDNNTLSRLLYIMNPNKIRACQKLILWHEKKGHKIIVFCDNIFALHAYANVLQRSYIYGATSYAERTRILEAFKKTGVNAINVVFLSKVGDNSIDIAEANVLIQISSHGGSRRQEAQRLGRILREKKESTNEWSSFNAFFYSLVSKDTTEMYYGVKRQRFLIDQGYSYKLIVDLVSLEDHGLYYLSKTTQNDLIETIFDLTSAHTLAKLPL